MATDAGESYSVDRLAGPVTGDADLDAVAALEAASFANPWTRDMLARELRQSDVARVYVLRRPDASIAAFCACWIIVDELHINTIAVDPAHRRQGLATRLLHAVLADGAAQGAVHATLEVRRSNDAACRLYQRLGFTIEAVRANYYVRPEEDALILWRRNLVHGTTPQPDPAPAPRSGHKP